MTSRYLDKIEFCNKLVVLELCPVKRTVLIRESSEHGGISASFLLAKSNSDVSTDFFVFLGNK